MLTPLVVNLADLWDVDLTSPSPARGDILYRGALAWENLPAGSAGKFLRTSGGGADPSWETVDLSGYLPLTGGTLTGPLVVNPVLGFTGSLIEAQINGVRKAKIDHFGGLYGVFASLESGTASSGVPGVSLWDGISNFDGLGSV